MTLELLLDNMALGYLSIISAVYTNHAVDQLLCYAAKFEPYLSLCISAERYPLLDERENYIGSLNTTNQSLPSELFNTYGMIIEAHSPVERKK